MLHSLILVLFSSRSFSFEYLSHLFPTTTQVADSSSINCNAQHACTAEMLLIVYHFVQGSYDCYNVLHNKSVLYTFPAECIKKVKQTCTSAVHRCAPQELFCYALLLLVVPRVLMMAYMYEESLWSTAAVALLLLAVTVGVDGGFDDGSSARGWWCCCHYQCGGHGNDVSIVAMKKRLKRWRWRIVAKVRLWWRRSCVCCCGGDVGGAGKAMNCGGGDGSCYGHNTVPRAVRESQFCRTTKKLSKRKKVLEKRTKDVFRVRMVPLFGNVMLVLLTMVIAVESFSPLPDGNGEVDAATRTEGTLNRIVDDWMDTNKRPGIEATYGHIGDWNVSLVQNFKSLFYGKIAFNADISKWNVAAAENMRERECSPPKIIFFGSVVLFFLFSVSLVQCILSLQNTSTF